MSAIAAEWGEEPGNALGANNFCTGRAGSGDGAARRCGGDCDWPVLSRQLFRCCADRDGAERCDCAAIRRGGPQARRQCRIRGLRRDRPPAVRDTGGVARQERGRCAQRRRGRGGVSRQIAAADDRRLRGPAAQRPYGRRAQGAAPVRGNLCGHPRRCLSDLQGSGGRAGQGAGRSRAQGPWQFALRRPAVGRPSQSFHARRGLA